jgi:outer membrane protein insertion porin family
MRNRICAARIAALFTVLLVPGFCRADEGDALSGEPVEEIRFSGLKYTREELVRDSLVSRVGEPYREETVARDRERLDQLGIFSAISIHPRQAAGGVLLDYELKETFPYLPLISADITDEDGLTIGPGLKAVNLFGRGIYFSGAARFGQATTVELRTQNPWLPGGHFIYRADAWYRDRYNEIYEFNENSLEVAFRFGRTFSRHSRAGIQVSYLGMKSDVDGITLSDDNNDNLRSAGFFLGHDSRDSWSIPHRGWWTELDVLKIGGPLGGDGDWWRFILDIRRYQPVRPRHTLALFSYASVQTGEVGKDLPVYMDYTIGGTNTIRGWDLAAREGKNEMIGTAEYRYVFREPRSFDIYGATFHLGVETALFGDVGIVWDDEDSFRSDNLIAGVGVGLRLLIPFVRVVRFDVAYGETGSQLNLHIGAFEKTEKQRERIR